MFINLLVTIRVMSDHVDLVPGCLLANWAVVGSEAWKMWVEILVERRKDMVSETAMCFFPFICVQINFGANWTFVLGNNSHITMFVLNPSFEV